MKVRSLADAVRETSAALTNQQKHSIREMSEDDLIKLHFSLGQWVRNRIVYTRTDFAEAIRKAAIFVEPDDISGFVVEAVWADLRREELDIEEAAAKHFGADSAKAIVRAIGG